MKPEDVLSTFGAITSQVGATLPAGWRPAMVGVGAALGLVADLIRAGRDPVTTVEKFRSWVAGAAEVDAELDSLMRDRAGG